MQVGSEAQQLPGQQGRAALLQDLCRAILQQNPLACTARTVHASADVHAGYSVMLLFVYITAAKAIATKEALQNAVVAHSWTAG
jgi:hypothetical protein